MNDVSRRSFLAATAGAGVTAALPWSLPGAGEAAAAQGTSAGAFAEAFAAPARSVQGRFRWWWPHGLVDPTEIAREIDEIADAGFGGVEIADVHHSVEEPLDPAEHGWGTGPWVAAVEAALGRAAERDVTVDITIGPSWPAALPTVTPQSTAAATELAHGLVQVDGGSYDGEVPAPVVAPASGVTEHRLYTVQAARLADGAAVEKPYRLDQASVTDLTASVRDGHVGFTAPDAGTWLIIATWLRGSGQRPEGGPHTDPVSYVVDHFSAAGTQAVIDFWEGEILTPRMRELIGRTGGAMFEDSIELETEASLWTPAMLDEFRRRRGYDLLPYLPVVLRMHEDGVFSYDGVTDRRVADDLNAVRSELYIEHHLRPLQEWLHGLGLELRIQPYGLETDAMASSAIVDTPEGESLGFNNLDDFRSLAGGRDMGGNERLSSEAAAVYGGSYSTTWDHVVRTVSREYAAGVNQAVLHGFSYAYAPGARWPGFAAFTPYDGGVGYSESWGPRHPIWRHAPDIAGFLARSQLVLQTGRSRVDVAFLRQKGYAGTGFGAAWFTPEGIPRGWTHQFLSPSLLELPSARVAGARLAPDGPGYKMLVFEGDAFNGKVETMPLATARRLLEFARAGLPILAVGGWDAPTVPGVAEQGENEELAEVMARLLAQPSVHRVDSRAGIADGVAALGLQPDVRYAESSPLLHARRHDEDAEYYYFVNGSADETVDHDVTFATAVRPVLPYRLDLWTGGVERAVVHESDRDLVRLRVRLEPGASTVIVLARPNWRGDGVAAGSSVLSTEADAVVERDGRVVVRAAASGTYRSTLANGRTVSTRIASLPEDLPLTDWKLTVEDWRPGASPTETDVRRHERRLDSPVPWTELPDLADVSGVGRYSATVHLGAAWTGGHGAYLHLGEVTDTFRVVVNGNALPPADQQAGVVDVGGFLRQGRNTIEIETASTLINRMRVFRSEVYGAVDRARYGLAGPVRLVPYGQVRLM
ncbi:glycosyl hydrolase [Actinopolyspora halophila]|uniref:glycosyl hydrolase n=1 Tax=Actinopolyspora halophila TaxID=1850 RepID=UPI0003659CC5|nr:glycosyl hydrolase [Actinopolyspora halophila]